MNGLAVKVVTVRWLRPVLTSVVGLALYAALLVWGGLPAPEHMPFLVFSAVLLLLVLALLGWAAWRLIFKPLPPGIADPAPISVSPGLRRAAAALIAISGINIIVGTFWAEVWRREYALPFGATGFWQPELLTYAGFTLVLLLAGGGLWHLAKHAHGSLLQRFRAHPAIGLLVLTGLFIAYQLPAELLWRFVYGDQLSGWSMPNLLRGISFVGLMVLAAALYLSTQPVRRWNTITALRSGDLFLLMTGVFSLVVLLQVLTVEWDAGASTVIDHQPPMLLPAVLLLAVGFTGVFVLRATRRVGAATLTGLMAWGLRMGLIRLFGYNAMSADPWIVVLPPLVALDAWYFLELIDVRRAPNAMAAAATATVGLVLGGFPLIDRLFLYPHITINNFPLMALAGFLGALGGAALGTQAGDFLATRNKQLAGLNHIPPRMKVIPAGGLAVVLAFITAVILTATPPV